MRRNTIQIGESFLTLTPKLLIISKNEFVLMICTNCGYRRSSYVTESKLDRSSWEFLASKLDRLPRCQCSEVPSGTNSNK